MDEGERRFAVLISGAHGVDHFLKRVFPPLVPVWALSFGYPLWKLGVILGAISFGSAVVQAPVGHLSDRYDRRYLLPGGIALMGFGFVCFVAVSVAGPLEAGFSVAGTPLSWRFVGMTATMGVVGAGSSTIHPTGYPLISRNVDDAQKGTVLGMWGSARSFGDGFAPALVGVALLVTGWRSIVVGFGLLGAAYAAYLFWRLRGYETRPVEDGDAPSEGDGGAANSWPTDRRRFLYPVLAVMATSVLVIVATTGANVFLTEFVTSEYGYSFAVAGFDVTPESTASFYYSALLFAAGVTQLGTGRLIDRFDHRSVLLGHIAVGGVLLLAFGAVRFSPPLLFAVLLCLGASLWGLNPARDAIVTDVAPSGGEGRTFGYMWTGMLLVSSVSPAVVGYIGDVASLREAFLLLAGFVFAAAVPIASLLSNRVYLDPRDPESGETSEGGL